MQIYGNPENQIRLYILARDVQKPVNLQFDFQGCQKLQVRVAISQKANEIDLPDTIKVIDYMIINNAMILLVLGDFVYLDWLWAEVWDIYFRDALAISASTK